MIRKLSSRTGFQLLFLFGGFALCRVLTTNVFFEGFLSTFNSFNLHYPALGKIALFTHSPFTDPSIILSSLLHPLFFLALVILYVPFILKRKRLSEIFSSVPFYERLIPSVCALLLAWELSTYDYNYYLGSAFYFDRFLLILLALLIVRFPVVTPFFIAAAYVYRAQFNFPVDGFPLFDKRVLFDVLVMYCVFFYAKLFLKEFRISFLFPVLCIVGSDYFMSAAGKIFISPFGYEWLTRNKLTDLFANIHLRGWMMKGSWYEKLYAFLQEFGRVFMVITFIIEFAGILVLRSRRAVVVILLSAFLMHVGIFIFGSMLFWKWMVLDLLLVFVLVRYKTQIGQEFFSKKFFWSSVIIILTSFLWLKPFEIAWWDTEETQFYRYEVVDDKGNVFAVDKNEMNPYHQWFEYDRFDFLVDRSLAPLSGFGYVHSYYVKQQLDSCHNDSLFAYARGWRNAYDTTKKAAFGDFIKKYFYTRNNTPSCWMNYFAAPDHLHTSSPSPCYDGSQRIKTFRVYFVQAQHTGSRSIILRDEMIDEVSIPQ